VVGICPRRDVLGFHDFYPLHVPAFGGLDTDCNRPIHNRALGETEKQSLKQKSAARAALFEIHFLEKQD
jgi:hypothetical protein